MTTSRPAMIAESDQVQAWARNALDVTLDAFAEWVASHPEGCQRGEHVARFDCMVETISKDIDASQRVLILAEACRRLLANRA